MNAENNTSQPTGEAENPSNVSEITDRDLEQVSGGLSSASAGNPLFKPRGTLIQDKFKGNNLGDFKVISADDESPKE